MFKVHCGTWDVDTGRAAFIPGNRPTEIDSDLFPLDCSIYFHVLVFTCYGVCFLNFFQGLSFLSHAHSMHFLERPNRISTYYFVLQKGVVDFK